MRVLIRLDGARLRRWHHDLLGRIGAVPGIKLSADLVEGGAAAAEAIGRLFRLEAWMHRRPAAGSERAPESAFKPWRPADTAPDLTIDLHAHAEAGIGRVWRVRLDGAFGEEALLAAALAGGSVVAEILEGERVIAAGRLGTEHGGVALLAFEDMAARLTTLITAALSGGATAELPRLPEEAAKVGSVQPNPPNLARRAARAIAGQAVRRLYRLVSRAPHWRTGWRKVSGGDLYDLRQHPDGGWRDLPDDGLRFYADPFPLLHRGALTLFVEDYEHRLGKGVISAIRFGPDGPIGRFETVLEQPGHLSYPFVFEQGGEAWMIPESCSAGTVDLFRATAYPGGWTKEATLLSGIAASDATLIEHEGRWWLFATVHDGGGAYSDALCLWSAPDFRGPFVPHPRNPVLIDIASARPAGRLVRRDGALLRPVQDCRRGYGAALGIARVLRLDEDAFEQQVETILGPGPLWPGRRLHTLNAAGGFEFIDGSRLALRGDIRPPA